MSDKPMLEKYVSTWMNNKYCLAHDNYVWPSSCRVNEQALAISGHRLVVLTLTAWLFRLMVSRRLNPKKMRVHVRKMELETMKPTPRSSVVITPHSLMAYAL